MQIFYNGEEIRLDKFLTQELQTTRNQIESLIKLGHVRVEGKSILKSGFKLKEGMVVEVEIPKPKELEEVDVGFDVEIIYEDDYILVIDKPPFVTVHGAPSVRDATLVDWLISKGIALSTIAGELRYGIVHRLDKETSGVMVVAKDNASHLHLSEQLKERTMGRYYLALIDYPLKEDTIVNKPIARNPKNRLKMGVVAGGREAKSAFAKLASAKNYELIAAKLFTGRTHQIRVHLSALNRHILGDSLYGFKSQKDTIARVFLHAYILYLTHPKTGERLFFEAKIPKDMNNFLQQHFDTEILDETITQDSLIKRFSTHI